MKISSIMRIYGDIDIDDSLLDKIRNCHKTNEDNHLKKEYYDKIYEEMNKVFAKFDEIVKYKDVLRNYLNKFRIYYMYQYGYNSIILVLNSAKKITMIDHTENMDCEYGIDTIDDMRIFLLNMIEVLVRGNILTDKILGVESSNFKEATKIVVDNLSNDHYQSDAVDFLSELFYGLEYIENQVKKMKGVLDNGADK